MPETDPMKSLTEACLEAGLDYQRARNLIIRGEVAGEYREGKWYCDPAVLAEWKGRVE